MAAAVASAMPGCTPPCRALAETICECEPNGNLKEACLQELEANDDLSASKVENEVCAELLDGCTCDALEREQYGLCGLSKRR